VVLDEVGTPWRPADVAAAAHRKVGLLGTLAGRFSGRHPGVLVYNTLPLPRQLTGQLVDHRSRAEIGVVWREANAALLRLAEQHPALVVLDLDPMLADGMPAQDPRLDRYAKTHLSPALLAGYAREVGHLARHLAGRTKKCLVLDLDDTVWGGVLGDDGPDAVEVATGYRGEAFRAFQRVVRQIGSQGVLLAAVSKNDPEPVRAVLRDHPGMTLREPDFVRVVANWQPKHENLADLAGALDLGPDSFVFVDDSPQECALVRQALPDTIVVRLDGDPALHVPTLLADGWFDVLELTAEDRVRGPRYRDQLARADFGGQFESIEDYLRELDITVRLAEVGEPDVARVSQLTLRTNQFNLTTHRLRPTEVRSLLGQPGALTLAVHTADRFGDSGIVGAVFGHRDGDRVLLDNVVLSCRVLCRGIEQACMSAVLRRARAEGATAVCGRYRRTVRNSGVEDLYPRYGFTRVSDDGTTATFRHDLADIIPVPDHLTLIEDFGRTGH